MSEPHGVVLSGGPWPDVAASEAGAGRWRPARAGLIGLWRYWDETFAFHRGRLLLRGPNGSGKSMALELLLPFLLDGDASPAKLTSAAKPRGRLFDRVMAGSTEASRVGFAWVEFRRGDEVFTAGARIRASHATARAEVDLFTTTRAVGSELHLLDEARRPLSRKDLAEAIGDSGRVHDSAAEHRAAVRAALFPGFSASRFDSVVGALLSLRREKLSQNLDLDKLSEVLSEALPPLDDHDIAAVAEGFERLDRRRAELDTLERDLAEVKTLARLQRDYARAVLAASAGEVRSAETRRDDVTRREREARESFEAAEVRSRALSAERDALGSRSAEIVTSLGALKDGAAYREGAALSDLKSQARRLRALAVKAAERAAGRRSDLERAAVELEQANATRHRAESNAEAALRDLRASAGAAGAEVVLAEAEQIEAGEDAERLLRAFVGAQRAHIAEVRAALDAHDRAVQRREVLDAQVAEGEQAVERREAEADRAAAHRADAAAAYATSVRDWAASCEQLGSQRLLAALPHPAEDPVAVAEALRGVVAEARAEEAVARRRLLDERQRLENERSVLAEERAGWERGELRDPEAPPWRSPRQGRQGAALWRLVDVAAGVEAAHVDGIEAALVASGLLDAWVEPGGGIELEDGRADVVLTSRPIEPSATAGSPGGHEQAALDSLLVPAPEAAERHGVPLEVVAGVLASVAVVLAGAGGAGAEVALALDGTYRLGSAVGAGALRRASLLGALARERHRLARLAELDAAIEEIDAAISALEGEVAGLDRRRVALEAEIAALPSGDELAEAERAQVQASGRLVEAREALERLRDARRAVEEVLRQALRELTALAARHGMPTTREALAELERALQRLGDAAGTWERRRSELARVRREESAAAARAERAEAAARGAEEELAGSEREAAEAEGRAATLESSIGEEFAEVLRRIAALEEEQKSAGRHDRELTSEAEGLARRLGELGAGLAAASAEREVAEEKRESSQRRLVACLDALGPDAALELPGGLDTATGVLAAARAIAAATDQVASDQPALSRLNGRVAEKVHAAQAALAARVDFDRVLSEGDWWVLRATANGLRRSVGELHSALERELEAGREELAEEEERLFEQTLAGSVRRALADRIRQANALTDAINTQLAAIRSAAGGVQVRLRWEVDPEQPEAVRAARSLLLRDPADLSDAERDSLQDFVRARVDQARAELEANAPWEARLRETLDYRGWHRFALLLAHRDWEGFVPATPRRLQKLSTGERSIALHLPMIASVAAHYESDEGAPAGCPRLILLDELFAGVDTANRSQLFGTFSAWDLDAVFTSDHEWCQYESLDGIAIHHLHPPAGDEPVTSTRFTWDGRRRRIDPPAA